MTDKKHKCHKCGHSFMDSTHLNRHLNNSSDCVSKVKLENIRNHICKGCNCSFSRKDSLDRHLKTCKKFKSIYIKSDNVRGNNNNSHNTNSDITNSDNTNSDIAASINGVSNNNNNIRNNNNVHNNVNVNYNLVPFCKESVMCLSPSEKIQILTSDTPFHDIISKINFDPDKKYNHNIYYKIKDGYGKIFNGDDWVIEPINSILNSLNRARHSDLIYVHDELDEVLPKDTPCLSKTASCLRVIAEILEPKNNDSKQKKILNSYTKKIMDDNSELGKISMDRTKNIPHESDSQSVNPNIELLLPYYAIIKANNDLKFIAGYLLSTFFDDTNPTPDDIIAFIDNTHNNKHLNLIVTYLASSSHYNINVNAIKKYINRYDDMIDIINLLDTPSA